MISAELHDDRLEALERIAAALERLVALETRKAQAGARVFDLAAQQREAESRPRLRVLSDRPA